jgi:hypothetical protein
VLLLLCILLRSRFRDSTLASTCKSKKFCCCGSVSVVPVLLLVLLLYLVPICVAFGLVSVGLALEMGGEFGGFIKKSAHPKFSMLNRGFMSSLSRAYPG